MSDVRITIEAGEMKYILPVLPPSLEFTSPTGNETTEVLSVGEISILKNRKLRTLTIESFFPPFYNSYPFICVDAQDFRSPGYMIEAIDTLQVNKSPVRVTIEGIGLSTFWASIEDFTYKFSQSDDVDYTLSLREFRPYGQRAKTMERQDTVFDWEEDDDIYWEAYGLVRHPSSFSFGDRVVVSGKYFLNPNGLLPSSDMPSDFLQRPYSASLAAEWIKLDGVQNVLNGRRCVIIDIEDSKTDYIDLPIIGYTARTVTVPYRFCVADLESRKKIGWVSEYQMVRI